VLKVDAAGLNREMVLENKVVVGTVNANRRHYERAAAMLAQSNRTWLENLITRRVPIEQFAEAFERRDGDVKTILTF
jgi:threonine dehydrogenase-like Zn-dependent dehydrogenase